MIKHYYTFQKVLLNNIITVNISSLPNNMQKDARYLAPVGKCPQEPLGPIAPNPGPIFPNDDEAAVNDVIKS